MRTREVTRLPRYQYRSFHSMSNLVAMSGYMLVSWQPSGMVVGRYLLGGLRSED